MLRQDHDWLTIQTNHNERSCCGDNLKVSSAEDFLTVRFKDHIHRTGRVRRVRHWTAIGHEGGAAFDALKLLSTEIEMRAAELVGDVFDDISACIEVALEIHSFLPQ